MTFVPMASTLQEIPEVRLGGTAQHQPAADYRTNHLVEGGFTTSRAVPPFNMSVKEENLR